MSIDVQLQAVLDEIQQTVLQRHQKYGPTNVSGSPGGPLNGLRVRLHDKLARINNFVDHGGTADFTDDAFRDAFVDVVGYGLIGLLVVDGQWPTGAVKPEHPTYRDKFGQVWRWYDRRNGYGVEACNRPGFSLTNVQEAFGPLTEIIDSTTNTEVTE